MTSLDDVGEEETSLYFASTQMQLAYEESERLEHGMSVLTLSRSHLQRFNNPNHKAPAQTNGITEKKITRKKGNKPRARRNGANRIKSLSAHVEKVFGLKSAPDSFNTDNQQSILRYFSGKKRKVDEILSQLDKEESPQSSSGGEVDFMGYNRPYLRGANMKFPYNKEEWIEIIDTIKESLPHLSDSTKRTLTNLTKRIEDEQSFTQSKIEESSQLGESMLWEKASHQPSTELTPLDIRSLYDLNSQQMQPEGDTSFTRGTVDNGIWLNEEEEIISDSCSEPEIVTIEYLDKNDASEKDSIKFDQTDLNFDKEEKELIEVQSSESEPEPEAVPLDEQYQEITSSIPTDQEVIVSSSVASSPVKSVRATPKKQAVSATRFETPTKAKSIDNTTSIIDVSPLKLTPPHFSSSVDTNYATASSQFSKEALDNKKRPLIDKSQGQKFRTRIVEIASDIDFKDVVHKEFKIRKIGERSRFNKEDEIIGSDDDDNDISIIEISSLIDEDKPQTNGNSQNTWNGNTSVLQVPSSPNSNVASSPQTTQNNETPDIFGTARNDLDGNNNPGLESDFNNLSFTQMKSLLKEWGFNPPRTKQKMIEILTNANRIVQSENPTQLSQAQFTDEMYYKLIEKIKSNENWLSKINSYEPILIDKLKDWLQTEDFDCEEKILQNFCDALGICYSNNT